MYTLSEVAAMIETWRKQNPPETLTLISRHALRFIAGTVVDGKTVMTPNHWVVGGCGCLLFTAFRDVKDVDLRAFSTTLALDNDHDPERWLRQNVAWNGTVDSISVFTYPFDRLSSAEGGASPEEISQAIDEVVRRFRNPTENFRDGDDDDDDDEGVLRC